MDDRTLEKTVNLMLTLYHCLDCGLNGNDWEEFKKLKAEFMGQAADSLFFKCPKCGNKWATVNLNILDKQRKEKEAAKAKE
jgi:predicted RNA-binding Zn-ribbon protein involved in translation (DUF1610 family)